MNRWVVKSRFFLRRSTAFSRSCCSLSAPASTRSVLSSERSAASASGDDHLAMTGRTPDDEGGCPSVLRQVVSVPGHKPTQNVLCPVCCAERDKRDAEGSRRRLALYLVFSLIVEVSRTLRSGR